MQFIETEGKYHFDQLELTIAESSSCDSFDIVPNLMPAQNHYSASLIAPPSGGDQDSPEDGCGR
jgi:hypothetical protein